MKRFEGELKHINPEYLVGKEFNKLESFFLGLGLVFNDLKGLIVFEDLLSETYERPSDDEVDSNRGNFGGMLLQISKLMGATISEFFIFLKENAEVFDTTEFKTIFERLNTSEKKVWLDVLAVSRGESPKANEFFTTLAKIRNNLAFHFDHSGKMLDRGYRSRFFVQEKSPLNKQALFSIGETLGSSRFFFSDAAVEEALYIAAGKDPNSNEEYPLSFNNFRSKIDETVKVMVITISALMENYIESRRNQPH